MGPVSLKEAKNRGLRLYYTGKPCKYGHDSERWVSSRKCRECERLNHKDHYQKNKERLSKEALERYYSNRSKNIERMSRSYYENREQRLEDRRRHYYENPENEAERHKRYRRENPEKCRLIQNEYRSHNPGIYNAAKARYKAQKRQATPSWSDNRMIGLVYKKAKKLSDIWGVKFHVDHIAPINSDWVCGLHVWENLQLLDSNLNCRKNNGRAIGE